MFSKSKELIKLIDKEIDILKNRIKEIENKNTILLNTYNDLVNDNDRLIYLSDSDLKVLINKFDIEDKDELFKGMLTIKKIQTMNKDYKSTLRLFKKDKDNLTLFLESFNKLNKELKDNNPDIISINNKIEEFDEFKSNIKTESYFLTSNDLKLLETIFKNNNDTDSQNILLELITYENKLFEEKIARSKKINSIKVSTSELETIFNKYNYDFNSLNDKYKDYLIHNGNLNNIKYIFEALELNEYPHIDNDYILTSILLASSKETINAVTEFAKKNSLIPKSLLNISGALLIQKDDNEDDELGIMTTGSSLDFMRNINTIKKVGISVNYIFQGCKSILTMPNKLLEKNLNLFNMYGFSFEYKKRGVIDPSPSALLSTNFANIVDQFIEIHPLGLKYLIDNLSNVKTVSNPNALMFYNIYESEKTSTGNLNDPEDGPFRKVMEENNENYQLKAIITRNRPDYRNTYYKEINEDNKIEKTNTLNLNQLSGKELLDKVVNNVTDDSINNSIFNNSYIKTVNKYIDKDSALVYNFKGVRISRLKVLRIYNILMKEGIPNSLSAFMYAITYNSIISLDDYNIIYNAIRKEVGKR